MSYSFTVRAATVAAAVALVSAEFDKVVEQQPIHAKDRDPAIAAAKAFAKILVEDPNKDVVIGVNGSLSWRDINGSEIHWANVNVAARLETRETT